MSTRLRAPLRPLLTLPETLSELTGPVYGHDRVSAEDADLTSPARGAGRSAS